MAKHGKRPTAKHHPAPTKHPRISQASAQFANSTDGLVISWHLGTLDRKGPYGWHNVDVDTMWRRIHCKLSAIESLTWSELASQGSHAVPVADLCKDARTRLSDIQQDDLDDLYSLRLSGKERIWGIRDRHVLKVIWWDPNHEVCVSKKKHT